MLKCRNLSTKLPVNCLTVHKIDPPSYPKDTEPLDNDDYEVEAQV
jgi:hypothetical protein